MLWLATNLVIRGIRMVYQDLGALQIVAALVPVVFIYAPVLACRWRGIDPDRYPITLPAFGDWRVWKQALLLNAVVIGIVILPFTGLYHLWHTAWLPALGSWVGLTIPPAGSGGSWPDQFALLVGYHLFYAAIPEEIFYRGYMQSRLDEAFGTPWTVFGAAVGPGLLLTAVLFAFGHSLVFFQWWHVAIVVPALAFGWMRSRTGEVMAGAIFHAWCNVYVTTLDNLYGVAGI